MGGKTLRLIITDEDAAMKVAIGSIFLEQFIYFACGTLWRRCLRRLAIQQIEIHNFGLI
jgi:hypothetical protein